MAWEIGKPSRECNCFNVSLPFIYVIMCQIVTCLQKIRKKRKMHFVVVHQESTSWFCAWLKSLMADLIEKVALPYYKLKQLQ